MLHFPGTGRARGTDAAGIAAGIAIIADTAGNGAGAAIRAIHGGARARARIAIAGGARPVRPAPDNRWHDGVADNRNGGRVEVRADTVRHRSRGRSRAVRGESGHDARRAAEDQGCDRRAGQEAGAPRLLRNRNGEGRRLESGHVVSPPA